MAFCAPAGGTGTTLERVRRGLFRRIVDVRSEYEDVKGDCGLEGLVVKNGLLGMPNAGGWQAAIAYGQALTWRSDIMSSISAGTGTVRGVELQKGSKSGSGSAELGSVFSLVANSGVFDEDAAIATAAMWMWM